MEDNISNSFFAWADNHGLSREDIAKELGKEIQTISNWKVRGIPKSQYYACQALMDRFKNQEQDDTCIVRVEYSGDEFDEIDQAAKLIDVSFRDFVIRSSIARAREEIEKAALRVSKPSHLRVAEDDGEYGIIEIPFVGAAAAGEPVEAPRDEMLPVRKEYPPQHFIVEICGQSGEPEFQDGSRWIIDGRDCYTPKHGKPCIISDENGSYLKKYDRKRKVFESINPAFADVIPGDAAKLQGYPVEEYKF